MNDKINNSVKSAANQAKESKDFVENYNKEPEQKEPDRSKAGLNKPAVFGIHNPNFNKNCLHG